MRSREKVFFLSYLFSKAVMPRSDHPRKLKPPEEEGAIVQSEYLSMQLS